MPVARRSHSHWRKFPDLFLGGYLNPWADNPNSPCHRITTQCCPRTIQHLQGLSCLSLAQCYILAFQETRNWVGILKLYSHDLKWKQVKFLIQTSSLFTTNFLFFTSPNPYFPLFSSLFSSFSPFPQPWIKSPGSTSHCWKSNAWVIPMRAPPRDSGRPKNPPV